ncbi:MAG: DUF1016 N-terminal domain-containing protein [Sedimentibacter sp.]
MKGFTVRNLNNMRAFYIAFPNWNSLSTNLSWTHYILDDCHSCYKHV